jgi:quercetin dioxygenase-like cupin family protein
MLKKRLDEVPVEEVNLEGAKGVKVQWLFSPKDGVPTFAFRVFHIAAGGETPRHIHDWEHEVLILEGEGEVYVNGEYVPYKKGDAFFIPGGEEHQFLAKSNGKFICLIPNSGC